MANDRHLVVHSEDLVAYASDYAHCIGFWKCKYKYKAVKAFNVMTFNVSNYLYHPVLQIVFKTIQKTCWLKKTHLQVFRIKTTKNISIVILQL